MSQNICVNLKKMQNFVNQDTARFINQSMEKDFPLNDNEFDVCNCWIHTICRLNNLFKEINRVLKIMKFNPMPSKCVSSLKLIEPRHMILQLVYFFKRGVQIIS